jgi:hypothetical protein
MLLSYRRQSYCCKRTFYRLDKSGSVVVFLDVRSMFRIVQRTASKHPVPLSGQLTHMRQEMASIFRQQVESHPGFHALDRSECTRLLETEPLGTFIISSSSHRDGSDYVLSHTTPLRTVNRVALRERGDGLSVRSEGGERVFASLSLLIAAYPELLARPYSKTLYKQRWWCSDAISRDEAEFLFKGCEPGTFLISPSSIQRGECYQAWFVGRNDQVEKGLIPMDSFGFVILQGKQFESLDALVAAMQRCSIFSHPLTVMRGAVVRFKIVREIVTTEQSYVASLDSICNWYLVKCRGDAGFTQQDVSDVFANVAQLLPLHRRLLKDMEAVLVNWNANTSIVSEPFVEFVRARWSARDE